MSGITNDVTLSLIISIQEKMAKSRCDEIGSDIIITAISGSEYALPSSSSLWRVSDIIFEFIHKIHFKKWYNPQ